MADVVASFRARSLPIELGGAHVRISNGTDTALDGTLSTVASNVPAYDRANGVVLGAGATQLLYNTGFAGAVSGTPGTAPTGWFFGGVNGSLVISAIGLGNAITFSVTAGRQWVYQTHSITSGTTYTLSAIVIADGVLQFWQILHMLGASGTFSDVARRTDGVAVANTSVPSAGVHVLEYVVTATSTGTITARVGAGCAGSTTGSSTIEGPQFEAGSFRTSYIYNTSTSAALVRQPSYISSTLSALGVASQVNEYTIAVAVKMPFSSAVAASSTAVFATLFQGANNKLQIEHATTAGRIGFTAVVNSNTETAHVSGLTWAFGDVLVFALSKGATNGLIAIADGTVATNTSANGKAVFGSSLTSMALCADHAGASHATGTILGYIVADRAYSQAELEALSIADFLPEVTGTYLEDDWVDTNGTLAAAHTIRRKRGSEAWTYTDSYGGTGSSASITVQSNRIQFASANSSIVTDLGQTDYTLEFPWHIGSTSGERLAIPIRWTDINNQYYLNLREPNDDWTLYKIASGSQTTVATGSYTFNTSTTYMVKIVVSGTSVHAYINGVSLTGAQTMDTSLTATKAGLGTAGSTTAVTLGTVRFHNNVQIAATGDIDPDGQTALTLAGFVAAPDEAYYREIAADLEGTPTTSSAQVNVPLTDFAPDGAHETTRWRTDYDLVLSDGVDTLVQSAQVDPVLTPNAEDFTLTSGASVVDGYNPVPGAVGGDDFFAYWHTGDGVRNQSIAGLSDAGSGYMVPATLPAQGRRMAYDVSAGAWLGAVDTAYFNIPSVGAKRVVGGIMASLRRGML